MIIAKQVPYDIQGSYWDVSDYSTWEFVGNRYYEKCVSEDYENWMKYGDDIIDECIADGFDNLKSAVFYYLGCTIKDEDERQEWERVVSSVGEYNECYDSEDIITRVLSLIHHTPYIHTTIRGNCQSDWQGVYLPKNEEKWLRNCESRYFNTGTEWVVFWNEDDYKKDKLYLNIYVIKGDEPKKTIADACGVSPNEVKLIDLAGYKQALLCALAGLCGSR